MTQSKESIQEKGGARGFPWLRASVFLIVLFAVIVPFTNVPLKLKNYAKELMEVKQRSGKNDDTPAVTPTITEHPKPLLRAKPKKDPLLLEKAYTPKEHFIGSKGDMVRMSKGFHFEYEFETSKGGLASIERKDKKSYVAEYKLQVKQPKASTSLDELASVNPKIQSILPGLGELLNGAEVSDFYYTLYENKVKRLEREILKLNELSTKHNFYDCETILNLTHKKSGQKMLLMQGDMDVVSDGSDGDRLAEMPKEIVNSTHYQPFTSYGWKKSSKTPNPMLAGWSKRIQKAKAEIADNSTAQERRNWLKSRLKMLERGVSDMKSRSYLIAEYDPFIVMPVNMITNRSDKHAARVGDYAVVIYRDKIYPAIVGDGGPTFKVGEGSLRLAKELNPRASSYSRPVSDVGVTYLVFSGSRERTASAPDLEKWHQRCNELLSEIGGLGEGYHLHQWKDLLATDVSEIEKETD